MNKEIHFFDLDGTLWEIQGKVWVISKDNPNVPLLKIDREEFNLIKSGLYKEDNIQVNYNDQWYWIPSELMDRIKKKRNLDEDNIGFSFREFFDVNYINRIKIILKNIIDLNNKKIDVGIITGRHDREGEQEFLNKLRIKLNELNLDINKMYYLGDRFSYELRDNISFSKSKLLLEHLIGIKIEKDKFVPLKQDWYKTIYFYDDEIQNIYTANKIQQFFNEIIRNTDDEVFNIIKEKITENELILYTNYISNNELNKFKTTKIILKEPEKFPIKLENLNVKKFKEF
jgi:hypothetical protein